MEKSENKSEIKLMKKLLSVEEKAELKNSVINGDTERAKEIIRTMDNINEVIPFEFGSGSVLSQCCIHGNVELVRFLVFEMGSDVNQKDSSLYPPLSRAIQHGNIEIIRLLIEAGAFVNFVDEYGSSALSSVTYNNQTEIFEFLMSSGIDLNICGGTALINASNAGNIEIVRRLIDSGVDINYSAVLTGFTALHYACSNNHFNIVEFLIINGADENLKNTYKNTPIELSKSEEIKEFIKNYKPTKFVLK